jgi:hypothetical protein
MSCEVTLNLDVDNPGINWKGTVWILSSATPSNMFSVLKCTSEKVYDSFTNPKFYLPWEALAVVYTEYPILDIYYMDGPQGKLDSYAYLKYYIMRQRLLLLLICDPDGLIIEPYPFVYVGQAEIYRVPGTPIYRIDATSFDDEIQIEITAPGYKDQLEWYTFTTRYEWKTLMIKLEKV